MIDLTPKTVFSLIKMNKSRRKAVTLPGNGARYAPNRFDQEIRKTNKKIEGGIDFFFFLEEIKWAISGWK